MRIIFSAKGEVDLQAFDPGPPERDQLRIRTLYSLMSTGSEMTILHQRYSADSHFAKVSSFPQLKTGVQAVGVVEQAGDKARDFSAGDIVFMRMAHGSHQVLPESVCTAVPDLVDLKTACWCGLAATAFRAAWAARFHELGHVLIIGAGPVGQMTLRWAKAEGVSSIAVADPSDRRLQLALRGGATEVHVGSLSDTRSAIATMNRSRGPETIIDTTGNPDVLPQALALASQFGKIILLGDTGFPEKIHLSSDIMTKGLTIQATHDSHECDGWDNRRIDARFFDHVTYGRYDLSGLITHEFRPDDCINAYALAERCRTNAVGILFNWQDPQESSQVA